VAVVSSSAQDTSAKWLLGAWSGSTPSPAGGGLLDRREIVFKEDGTFRGDIQSARGGLISTAGTWKLVGDDVRVEGIYNSRGAGLNGTKFTHSLKRKGEDELTGTGHSEFSNRTFDVSLKKTN
jgi:hypothetical protein